MSTSSALPDALARFCAAHRLSGDMMAGVVPTAEGQVDRYFVTGQGDVAGVEIQRYGEFGNNVIQMMHAIGFARKFGLQWVRINGFGSLFKAGAYMLDGGLRLLVDQRVDLASGAALVGRFFFWWGTAGGLRGLSAEETANIVRQDLRRVLRMTMRLGTSTTTSPRCVRSGFSKGPSYRAPRVLPCPHP